MLSAALTKEFGSPLYVYEARSLRAAGQNLLDAFRNESIDLRYALKANNNHTLLKLILEMGFGIDAVSLGEVLLAKKMGCPSDRISYTGNNACADELRAVHEAGVHVTLDAPTQLMTWSKVAGTKAVGVRINPAIGAGHHGHVITGGPDAKFGIEINELPSFLDSVNRLGLTVDTLHQHIGSGILDADIMLESMDVLIKLAEDIPSVHTLDFGGGFGIPYKAEDDSFPLERFAGEVVDKLERCSADTGRDMRFLFEPGRILVGPAGALLVTVTTVKRGSKHTFVGTDSGQHHLLRPALYDAYHRIDNLSRTDDRKERVTVVGNICESGDVLGRDQAMAMPEIGDVLAIRDAGAYGYSMASHYNLRPRPAEVLLDGEKGQVIRPREHLEDLIS